MTIKVWILGAAIAVVAGCGGVAGERQSGVQRMYVFNCGESKVEDVSRWTPGVNVGKPWEFSANCYLIRHAQGWLMWDSGINDNVATMPQGFQRGKVSPRYWLPKPLRAQLAEIGVAPGEITHVAFSHTHGDHVGNANLFAAATLYIQQAEYDAAFGPDAASKWNFEVTSYDKLRGEQDREIERRSRRVRRRLGDDHFDARPHARSPVAARPPAENRSGDTLGRHGALAGELGRTGASRVSISIASKASGRWRRSPASWKRPAPDFGSTTTKRRATGYSKAPAYIE